MHQWMNCIFVKICTPANILRPDLGYRIEFTEKKGSFIQSRSDFLPKSRCLLSIKSNLIVVWDDPGPVTSHGGTTVTGWPGGPATEGTCHGDPTVPGPPTVTVSA